MAPEIVGERFFVLWNDKEYSCQAIKANERMLYEIKFTERRLYITKTINQHGISFWTAIPQDVKLTHLVNDLGKQIENRLIRQLCVITTV